MLRRRRPLLRAAAIGGAGYMAGKKMGGRDGGAQDGAYEEPAAAAPPPAAPASGISNDSIARLKQLAELRDQGVLTDEEFNAEKQKVLDSA
jgi:putative oligomerization/nucleic acid binding protein